MGPGWLVRLPLRDGWKGLALGERNQGAALARQFGVPGGQEKAGGAAGPSSPSASPRANARWNWGSVVTLAVIHSPDCMEMRLSVVGSKATGHNGAAGTAGADTG